MSAPLILKCRRYAGALCAQVRVGAERGGERSTDGERAKDTELCILPTSPRRVCVSGGRWWQGRGTGCSGHFEGSSSKGCDSGKATPGDRFTSVR